MTDGAAPIAAWQPELAGPTLMLRPLADDDFANVYAAASDPLIWAQHPAKDRHEEIAFARYFESRLSSGGTLVVIDRAANQIIGWSGYGEHDPVARSVEIGWTFLARNHWGGGANREMKALMLGHAFDHVDKVVFRIAATNHRSQRAMEKIGGRWDGTVVPFTVNGVAYPHRVYAVTRTQFKTSSLRSALISGTAAR